MKLIFIVSFVVILIFFSYLFQYAFSEPFVYDKDLQIEKVYDGLKFPVSMSFLGKDDILVLEKNDGTVKRIINGQMLDEPVLRVDVDNAQERGLLGSAITRNSSGTTNVYLYFTELKDGKSIDANKSAAKEVLGNRIYKYDFINGKLVNPKLLFELPLDQQPPFHVGGKMVIGPDNLLYVVIGDLMKSISITQNIENGSAVNGSAGIIRMNLDGKPAKNIFGSSQLANYFAYGIRNSFGMDFDPITGKLWDTENGPLYGDEINLVQPGFNSGWKKVQGLWKPVGEDAGNLFSNVTDFNSFGQENNYQFPKLTWAGTIGITAIKFLNSTKLGEGYFGDMFVGDFNKGDIYRFDLSENRSNILRDSNMISEVEVNGKNHSVIYQDPFSNCYNFFKCIVNKSTSITDNSPGNTSLTLSTTLNRNSTWSWIYGLEYGVVPGNNYTIISSLAQNANVVSSHIVIQGFNETSRLWEDLIQCPSGKSGFINKSEFTCSLSIADDISKIQPIINAGWSSGDNKNAISNFYSIKIANNGTGKYVDLMPEFDITSFPIFGRGFGHITDIQVGPDGDLYILAINPEQIVDFDHSRGNQGMDGVIYKISRK
jgi:glucose/arabinose dehydrogenase